MITFSEIKEDHADELARVLIRAYANPPWNEVWTYKQARTSIDYTCSGLGARGYVALQDEMPVGAVLGRIQLYREYEFYINQVFIDPSVQKQNIGKRLLEFAELRLKEQGVCQISLSTIEADRGFYEKCKYSLADWIEMKKEI